MNTNPPAPTIALRHSFAAATLLPLALPSLKLTAHLPPRALLSVVLELRLAFPLFPLSQTTSTSCLIVPSNRVSPKFPTHR